MLKLEKISKTHELNVLLRARPTVLTASFLIALGYAVFVHVIALFLFKVAPQNIGAQHTLFSPVSVAIELPVNSGVYIALQDEEPVPDHLIAPEPKIPKFSAAEDISFANHAEYIRLQSPLHHVFLDFENSIELETIKESHLPLSIHFSGNIAEMSLLSVKENALSKETKKSDVSDFNKMHRGLFHVLVDQTRGEIFWWELIESEPAATAYRSETFSEVFSEVLSVLESLQFVPVDGLGILSGQVEIVVRI